MFDRLCSTGYFNMRSFNMRFVAARDSAYDWHMTGKMRKSDGMDGLHLPGATR